MVSELSPSCPPVYITYTPNAFDDVYILSTSLTSAEILEQIETIVEKVVYGSPLYVCSFNYYHSSLIDNYYHQLH